MKTPSWKFWLLGICFVGALELWSGHVWFFFAEGISQEFLMGSLLFLLMMVVVVAYGSAWTWKKIRKP